MEIVVVSKIKNSKAKHRMNLIAADIIECDENLHLCEQVCTNTESSYECSCNPGYTLSINRFSCNSEIIPSQLTIQLDLELKVDALAGSMKHNPLCSILL